MSTALTKVVTYLDQTEHNHLLEQLYNHHYDEETNEPDFDSMNEQELYDFCQQNNIEHIWTSVYELKQLLEDLP